MPENLFVDLESDYIYIVLMLLFPVVYTFVWRLCEKFRSISLFLVLANLYASALLLIRDGPALKEPAVLIMITGSVVMTIITIFMREWAYIKISLPGGVQIEGNGNYKGEEHRSGKERRSGVERRKKK
jgi:hypothetical protein